MTAHDPLALYRCDLTSPHGRGGRPQLVEYAEMTLLALTILARRYDPTRDRKKANPVRVYTDGAEREGALREAITAWR